MRDPPQRLQHVYHRLILTVALLTALGPLEVQPCPLDAQAPHTRLTAYDPSRPAPGGEPAFRRFADQQGLSGAPIMAIAQDSTGFLWVGGDGGLFRYDGQEFRHWAPDRIRHAALGIAVSPAGEVIVASGLDGVFRVSGDGVAAVPPPPGGWAGDASSVAFDGSGRLWVVHGGRVSGRSAHAGWTTIPRRRLGGGRARRVWPDQAAAVVATDSGVWQLGPGHSLRKLGPERDVVDATTDPSLGLLLLRNEGTVLAIRGDSTRVLLAASTTPRARGIGIAVRDGSVWISEDRYLVAFDPGSRLDVFGPSDGIESGNQLLVDREGSLWMGSFSALFQYPEPRTRRWSWRQGLPSSHLRYLARSGGAIAVISWQGLGFMERGPGGWRARNASLPVWRPACPLSGGGLLMNVGGKLLVFQGTEVVRRHVGMVVRVNGCTPAADGGEWLATGEGLLHLPRLSGAARLHPTRMRGPSPEKPRLHLVGRRRLSALTTDGHGRMWAAGNDDICSASEQSVLTGMAAWSCLPMPPGILEISSLVVLPSGAVWAASVHDGMFRLRAGRWEHLPGSGQLPTQSVLNLVPSRSGGVWVLGNGFVWRVVEQPKDPAGWRVVERLGAWQGLASQRASDLLEDPDGGVWVATVRGVIHVPAAARRFRASPPRVVLVEARADERRLPLDRPIRLAYGHNALELRFAALSFRDPSRLRFEVRLSRDASWKAVEGAPSFRWVGLRPGTYRIQVRASLDGTHWSPPAGGLPVRVDPPWYLRPWVLALAVLAAVVLLWAVYRARVAYLLGLERLRTRIAMDLHDEVGSGLASVGILSGVLATDGLAAEEVRSAAHEIARTAGELGDSLSDIVWSLQPGGVKLEELAARLVEQAGRLFADGDTEFRTELPDRWPSGPLPLRVVRAVLPVGLEALHNAARHARAAHVTLRLTPVRDAWILDVRDDGVGAAAERKAASHGGRGLPGMRRRAAEIGAELSVKSRPGRGTWVRLRFALEVGSSRNGHGRSRRPGRFAHLPDTPA